VLRIGDPELPYRRADGLLLIWSVHVADQGGGAGSDAGDTPAVQLFGVRGRLRHQLRGLLHRIDQRRIVSVGLRAINTFRHRPPLQIIILNRLKLIDRHVAAQPMVELLGRQIYLAR
jgi:hypothetical protein